MPAWGEDAGCYTATCAEFVGLTTQSDTAEHAVELLKMIVQDIVQDMLVAGETAPNPLPATKVDDGPFSDCP
jgi:predicted RNase H-like HicB family nuclease